MSDTAIDSNASVTASVEPFPSMSGKSSAAPSSAPSNGKQTDVMQPVSRQRMDGYDDTPIAERDYSFLNEGEPQYDFDPNESLDDFVARTEAAEKDKAEGKDKPQEGATEAKTEKGTDPTPETDKAPVEATASPELLEKAAYWDRFSELIDKAPETIIEWAVGKMGESQKAALLKSLNAAPVVEAALPDIDSHTYEAQSDLEAALLPRMQDVKSIPAMRQEIAQLKASIAQTAQQEVRSLHEPMTYLSVYGEIAMARMDAIAEAIGFDLPMPDLAAIAEALKDGRTTHRSAVAKVIGNSYKQKAAEHKQARAERPKTPGNSSTRQPTIKPGMSMVEIMRQRP